MPGYQFQADESSNGVKSIVGLMIVRGDQPRNQAMPKWKRSKWAKREKPQRLFGLDF